jgi:hypothetical protein
MISFFIYHLLQVFVPINYFPSREPVTSLWTELDLAAFIFEKKKYLHGGAPKKSNYYNFQ